jgi:hypothetical protein
MRNAESNQPDRAECLGQIALNPALTRDQRDQLEWCSGRSGESAGEVVWEYCAGGCCLRVARASEREDVRRALQEVVDAAASSGHQCSGVLVVQRGDGELFTLRVSRGRVYVKLLEPARTAEPRLASVIPLRTRRTAQRVRL